MEESKKYAVLSILIIIVTLLLIIAGCIYAYKTKTKAVAEPVIIDTTVAELETKYITLNDELSRVEIEMQGMKGQTNTQTIVQQVPSTVDTDVLKKEIISELQPQYEANADCITTETTDGKVTLYCIKRG